jgi:hypothetical protein
VIGAQAVTYQTSAAGSLDRKSIPTLTYTDTTLYGSLQPLEVKEDVTNIDYTIERYHFITPPTPAALASKATDRLVDSQGLIYRVFGAKVKPRANGTPHHVEIMLENPSGLNA